MIKTTVIGSYPVRLDGAKYAGKYFSSDTGGADDEALAQSVQKQLSAGVDIISDGQTSGDFINIFARNFSGIVIEERPIILDEIRYLRPSTVDGQKKAKKLIPKGVELKGIITGPYTMAKSSQNRHYKTLEELAFAYAEGLSEEAEKLDKIVDYIQVDEPFFSVDYPEYGRKLVEKVFSKVTKPRMLHVCGDVAEIFPQLTEYRVDYLEHEFAANPHLWDTVKKHSFKQTLGVGVVRSDENKAETTEEIKTRMETAVKNMGGEKLIFNPDCGLKNLSPQVAYAKLENMVKAKDILDG